MINILPREKAISIKARRGGFDVVAGPAAASWSYPKVIRVRVAYDMIVLNELVRERELEDDEDPSWKTEWLQYCKDGLGVHDDPVQLDDEAKADWVERAVRNFCNAYHFVEGIRKMEVEAI